MATRRTPLRVAGPGERPPKQPPVLSISDAAEAGDPRALLVAMRRRIAKTVEDPNCPPRDLAALTRRLQEISREIEAIDARAKQEADESDSVPDEVWDETAL